MEILNCDSNVLSISGGKDSTALLLAIERETPNLQAVFADTGNEHQQTYDYVHYLEQATGVAIRWVKADFSAQIERKRRFVAEKWPQHGVPAGIVERALETLAPTGNPFLDLCIWKGRFQSTKARFCSEELKKNPIRQQVLDPLLNAGLEVVSWQGVRADESPSRALLKERECVAAFESGGELWNYRPILTWSVDDVFAMHRKRGIRPNPLYSQGMGRVGCMPCIHARKDELLEISKRFPSEIARIAEWERIVSEACKRTKTTFFALDDVKGDGIEEVVRWAKTSRGGKHYDLFRSSDDAGGAFLCTSMYGLCE